MCFLCIFPEVIMFLIFNLDWNLKDFPQASCGDYQRLIITSLINVERHKNRWKCEMLHWLTALRGGSVCDSRDGAAPGGHRLALLSPGPRGQAHPHSEGSQAFPSSQVPLLWASDVFCWENMHHFLKLRIHHAPGTGNTVTIADKLFALLELTDQHGDADEQNGKNIQWGAGEPVVETPDGAWTQAWGLQTCCFLWDKCPSSPQTPAPTSVLQGSARVLLSMAVVGGLFLLYTQTLISLHFLHGLCI